MATLAVQLGGLCIAAGLIYTGVQGLRSGCDHSDQPTSKPVAIACLLLGGIVAGASLFAGKLMFPEG